MTSTVSKVARESVPANRKRGGDLRVMLSPLSVGATTGFMGIGTLEPGEYITKHLHPYSEEFLCVTEGEVTVRLDDQTLTLRPDEAFLIPIGAAHRIENNTTAPAALVFALAPLAPRPDLGHIDCESMPGTGPLPQVGG